MRCLALLVLACVACGSPSPAPPVVAPTAPVSVAAVPSPSPPPPEAPTLVAAADGPAPDDAGKHGIPFGPGLTRPHCNVTPQIPMKLVARMRKTGASASALLIVRCTLRETGDIDECEVLKSEPEFSAEELLQQMKTKRCDVPATKDGVPVAVRYTFKMKIVPP